MFFLCFSKFFSWFFLASESLVILGQCFFNTVAGVGRSSTMLWCDFTGSQSSSHPLAGQCRRGTHRKNMLPVQLSPARSRKRKRKLPLRKQATGGHHDVLSNDSPTNSGAVERQVHASVCVCVCVCTHICIHVSTCEHMCTHGYWSAHMCTHVYTHVRTGTHVYTCVHTCTHEYMCVHCCVHMCTRAHSSVHMCAHVHTCKQTYDVENGNATQSTNRKHRHMLSCRVHRFQIKASPWTNKRCTLHLQL